ncbi:radical SAM protein [Candidatus Magnetaquicoccus inordinatus]|uniref:radical SAM protein n=1 Tax=Candidatus Magnetaquicoccus inordinatus TaxID=2496818 RepID=UPI00102D0C76|nr:radical SAM protein [Candidatus Magnetaquicoccus inordinatus]
MKKLYSPLKFLRYTNHIEALRSQSVCAPVHIRIKPTNICNHDCWYCAYRVDHLQLGADMVEREALSYEKMVEIVDDCISMGVQAVTFSGGGDPLVYKHLPEMVERLAKGGIRVATLTNGANLKHKIAETIAQYATWVRISIDAWDDASYAQSRRIKEGDFSKLCDNIRSFVHLGSRCVLGISYIVTHENYQHIVQASQLFKELGVNHVKFSGVVVANSGSANREYHQSIMRETSAQIAAAQSLNDAHFTVIDLYHELDERFEKSYTQCPFLQFLTVIGADACVYTCQDKAYTEAGLLGNIRDRSFKEFWFSAENRQKLFQFNPAIQCRHHCVTHSKNLALLELLAIDPEHGCFV